MKTADAISQAFNRWAWRRCPNAEQTFFEHAEFPWTSDVESHWREIREELDALLQHQSEIPGFHEVSERESYLSKGQWKTFFFRIYGNDIAEARRLCPITTSIVDKYPDWTTVFFSILDGKKHIPAHRGPYKGVLRYHLGLIVPSSDAADCAIRVGQDVKSWREGESMIFDDTHEHEVWNHNPARRVVLFVDFIRPLPGLVGVANRTLLFLGRFLHSDVIEIRRKARQYGASIIAKRPRLAGAGR